MEPERACNKSDNAHERSIRATGSPVPDVPEKTRIRIVATPDSTVSPSTGLYESLRSVEGLAVPDERTEGGRPGAFHVKFGLGRIGLRAPAHEGFIPGMTKSSW